MSSNNQPGQKLNKKERRKNARSDLQTSRPPENECTSHDDIQRTPLKIDDPCPVIDAAPRLATDIDGHVEHSVLPASPKTESAANDSVATVPASIEDNDEAVIESEASCLPRPAAAQRRPKRFPIASAIPLLPPIEQKQGQIQRPKEGTLGSKTQVYTNHFPVTVNQNIMLYQYDVVVEKSSFRSPGRWEEAMNRDQRRRFVQQLEASKTLNFIFWYDESKCFYSTINLSRHQFPIVYTLPAGHENATFRFSILKLAGEWSTATIFDYLRSPYSNNSQSAIRILETLLKQALLPTTHCEGSLFYRHDDQRNVDLPDGFELHLGFFQALALTQAGLTLNLQTTITKFYPHKDIIDFLSVNLKKDIRAHGMQKGDYERARLVLNGCKITTRQSNYTQIYQIRSFSDIPARQVFTMTRQTTVDGKPVESQTECNLIQYYSTEKNIQLKYPTLRCLQCFFLHDRRDPKHLPMELCRIVQWQECERESATEQRDRQSHCIPTPNQRYKDIMTSLRSCNYRAPATLPLCANIGLSVDDREMKLINARILPPPVINNNKAEINMGRINLRGRFVEPHKLKSIAFVYFGPGIAPLPPPTKELMEKFVQSFHKMARQFGIGPIPTSPKDAVLILERDYDSDREANLAAIDTCFRTRKSQKCELVICIMDSAWNDLRATIKLNGTVTYGITTQCLLYSKLEEQMNKFQRNPRGHPDRILDNMCENLLRKINFKMQGINTQVDLPFQTSNLHGSSAKSKREDAWQFMGADVIHPVCRQEKPSIAAVVGSGDAICSTSAVRICKQWPRSGKCAIEAIVDLQQMVSELLEYYQECNKRLPNKIVFYRDGVDDGQFARILNYEIPQIKQAFKEIYVRDPLPLLTFVVVKKRHHTRFFLLDERNQTINIPPGLVVDTDIVHPGQFSFFLNSHKALQGTNRPALYHVLYDEIQFTADELQLLTYYLCFTDPRSSTSEAIPSLIHQADLAASNARDLFPDRDTSTNDGYAADALEEPTLGDIMTEHLRVHECMRDKPHFG